MTAITDQIIYRRNFIPNHLDLYDQLVTTVKWNETMRSRKTACFGEPYDYSEQNYDFQAMTPAMENISTLIQEVVGFKANNCLLNYYENGKSKMGFHADNIKMLLPETGIAIVSVGGSRIMQVRRTSSPTEVYNYILPGGSLFSMSSAMQADWKHGLPKVVTDLGRISLTFRQVLTAELEE